jgi:hypothetical protein
MEKKKSSGKAKEKSEKPILKKKNAEKPIAPRSGKMGFHGEENEKNLNPEE